MIRTFIIVYILFYSAITTAQSNIERTVNEVTKYTDSLMKNSMPDEIFKSNILLDKEKSKLIYVNFGDGKEKVCEIEKALIKPYNPESPSNIQIRYKIMDGQTIIGNVDFMFSIKDYRISKSDYSTVKGLKDYLKIYSKVIKGKYINLEAASEIAMKNGLNTIDEYKLMDDSRWKNNKECKRTKPTWILKEFCVDKNIGSKMKCVVKVNAKIGRVTSLFKEYPID